MAKRSHYNIRKSDDGAFALITGGNEVFIDGNLNTIEEFLNAEMRCVEKIPLSLINEPEPRHIRFPGRVKKYAQWLKDGKRAPPIELILLIPADGRQLKKPFDIYDGAHRFAAAALVGRKSISAMVVDHHENYEDANEGEYVDFE